VPTSVRPRRLAVRRLGLRGRLVRGAEWPVGGENLTLPAAPTTNGRMRYLVLAFGSRDMAEKERRNGGAGRPGPTGVPLPG
jgi:hypothetical protein